MRDKHWCVSAIWLLSLQRLLSWGAINRAGAAKKLPCEDKQADRTFIQQLQAVFWFPIVEQTGRKHGHWEMPAVLFLD